MRIFLAAVMVFIHSFCLAQHVSLNELIAMRNGGIESINQILLPKAWVFIGTHNPYADSIGHCMKEPTRWTHGSSYDSDKAYAFVVFEKSYDCGNSIAYQTLDSDSYRRISLEIKSFDMHLVDTFSGKAEDDKPYVQSAFEGAKYRVLVVVYTNKSSTGLPMNSYGIYVRLKNYQAPK